MIEQSIDRQGVASASSDLGLKALFTHRELVHELSTGNGRRQLILPRACSLFYFRKSENCASDDISGYANGWNQLVNDFLSQTMRLRSQSNRCLVCVQRTIL
jgi:hypothetical protein